MEEIIFDTTKYMREKMIKPPIVWSTCLSINTTTPVYVRGDRGDWDNQHVWLLQNMEKMKEVFGPYIQRLVVE